MDDYELAASISKTNNGEPNLDDINILLNMAMLYTFLEDLESSACYYKKSLYLTTKVKTPTEKDYKGLEFIKALIYSNMSKLYFVK